MLLGARLKFFNQGGGGVPRVTPVGHSTTKKFAEKQMMVVRFDTVHTDSKFPKLSPGMSGRLVVSSIQIVSAFASRCSLDSGQSDEAVWALYPCLDSPGRVGMPRHHWSCPHNNKM